MTNRSARMVLRLLVAAGVAATLVACGSGSPTEQTGTSTSSSAESSTSSARSAAASTSSARSTPASSSASALSGSVVTSAGGTGDAQAEDYCRQHGGEVQTRTAFWGTNGDQADWLPLAGSSTMCRFQADDEAKSRIYVDLTTLSSPQPTLAGLAYLSKIPMPSVTGGANPATLYCKDLGGSSTFGSAGAAGGGWVAKDDPDDVVVALCVFPDLSFIDEWGLAYHSDGTIRGTDLATAMEYQPGSLPPVFPTADAPSTGAAPTS